MRLRYLVALFVVVAVSLPVAAEAQEREPHALSIAFGADAGLFVGGEEFHVGFAPAVYGELYLVPRISLRLLGAWSRNEFIDQYDLFLEQYRAAFNVSYNWEAEQWHPFVTAGVSSHSARLAVDGSERSGWSTRPGFNAGGGIEYFARRKWSVKAEGTYYWVDGSDLPAESDGFQLSIGLKKYF